MFSGYMLIAYARLVDLERMCFINHSRVNRMSREEEESLAEGSYRFYVVRNI